MLLSREEAELVYKLHRAVMEFTNEQLFGNGAPGSAPAYSAGSHEKRHEITRAFLGRLDLIDAFIAANPGKFSPDELEIVSSWRHLVAGRFIALRQLKKHMILLACDGSGAVYGVTGLAAPIAQVIPRGLPVMIEIVLLPFRGKIVYDGVIGAFNVIFGPGSRRGFEDQYRTAKANHAVVTSLPKDVMASPARAEAPKPRLAKGPSTPVPDVRQLLPRLFGLIDGFCQISLNEEYAVLCRKLAESLARKRPSPLLQGKLETWGLRDHPDDRLGEFSRRPFPIPAPEAARDRSGFRRRGKHRARQGQGNPPNAQNPPVRLPLDASQPVGE